MNDHKKVFQTPIPHSVEELDKLSPLVFEWEHRTKYVVSTAEYTPFFVGLANHRFFVTRCLQCPYWGRNYTYGTPRPGLGCMYCGRRCQWVEIEPRGRIHSLTQCEYAGEMFKHLVPFTLVMVEFDNVDTLFMSQLKGLDLKQPNFTNPEELEKWIKSFIGKPVKAQFKKLIEPKSFEVTDVWFVPDG